MRSTRQAPNAAARTAARIRDSAIAQFAAHGFSKTTVRGIAEAADVSPGLVIHHFGSKDGLRTACDNYVFEALTETKRENAQRSPLVVAEMLHQGPMRIYAEYLLKSLLERSEHGQRFFDHYIATVEQIIEEGFAGYVFRRGEDRRAQATVIAIVALGTMMLEPRARGGLGTNDLASSMERLAPSLLDLYLHGFIESVPPGQSEHANPHPDRPGPQSRNRPKGSTPTNRGKP